MIISHKYKFIFIKTSKTAGTSIEIALSKFCDGNDIITSISPEDEAIRAELGYRGAQNDEGFYNHMGASEIKQLIDREIWDNYFKFCVERNPWDRYVSFYYYRNRLEDQPDINDYILSDNILRLKKMGYGNYTIVNEVVVDKVCLYEKLDEELREVVELIGLPENLQLPRAKSGFRKDRRHYSEVLNSESQDRISKIFSEEINMFDYQFEKK